MQIFVSDFSIPPVAAIRKFFEQEFCDQILKKNALFSNLGIVRDLFHFENMHRV